MGTTIRNFPSGLQELLEIPEELHRFAYVFEHEHKKNIVERTSAKALVKGRIRNIQIMRVAAIGNLCATELSPIHLRGAIADGREHMAG